MKRSLVVGVVAACLLAGCGHPGRPGTATANDKFQVVTSTPILADMVRQVAGDRTPVTSIIPSGADPHTFEPTLRSVRTIVHSQLAFTNYLMLEPHAVIRTIDSSLPPGARQVSLAEDASKYGAEVIPLVENATLDTLWLGLRVHGTAAGMTRSSEVQLQLESVEGPGSLVGWLAGTFGEPRVFFDSGRGVLGPRHTAALPPQAHTHMSWAFSEPGTYRARFSAVVRTPGAPDRLVPARTVTMLVGSDPAQHPELAGRTVLERGHADITTDLEQNSITVRADGPRDTTRSLDPEQVVVWVPSRAMTEVPAGANYRFLGRPGHQMHQLPQAVLGAHVHGEIDPHLWLSVRNAMAYVKVIRDALVRADPAGTPVYRERAEAYLARLRTLDEDVTGALARIPKARRHLVTTHNSFAYLARDHGLQVAGFVAPNPGVEPSMAQRRKLAATLRDLRVPAVFLEPTFPTSTSVLATVADEVGVQVCPIYSDTLDTTVTTYEQMMRFNANSLARCLGQDS